MPLIRMTEEHSQDDNKKTPYDEYLSQLKQQHNLTAKTGLKRLYELLKLEDPLMSKDDMYDRIVKDCLDIWQRQTIFNNMPDELKDLEQQKSGKKGREKRQEITVTSSGSEPTESVGNDLTNDNINEDKPDEWTIVSKKDPHVRGPPIQIDAQILEKLEAEKKKLKLENDKIKSENEEFRLENGKFKEELAEQTDAQILEKLEAEKKKLKLENDKIKSENEEFRLENGKFKEELAEQTKHYHDVLDSVNKTMDKNKPNKTITESLEYKTLFSQLEIANQRINELEQILKKDIATNPAIGFQNATAMQRENNENATKEQLKEVEFPAKDLSTFFLDQRQAKEIMYLKIEGNKVVGWESDGKRSGGK
jgi:hypothetical protein